MMRKNRVKIGAAFFSFACFCTGGYAIEKVNSDLQAAAATSANYYGVGEIFNMGGMSWSIMSVDGEQGYIQSVSPVGGQYISQTDIDSDLSTKQATYNPSTDSDRLGKIIFGRTGNDVSTLKLMSIAEYLEISKNEVDSSSLPNPNEFWLSDTANISGSPYRVMYVDPGWIKYSHMNPFSTYTRLRVTKSYPETQSGSSLYPVFKVKLPRKDFLQSVSFAQSAAPFVYKDEHTVSGGEIGVVEAMMGEGPYEFKVVSGVTASTDVNQSGALIGAGLPLSADFTLTTGASADKAILRTTSGLKAGIHYVKVEVKDAVGENGMYIDANDPERIKSVIIKIDVKKGIQDPILVYSDNQYLNEVKHIAKSTYDTNFEFFPKGGSAEIPDTEFTYSIHSNTDGIINTVTNGGTIGKVTLSGKTGVATIRITKLGKYGNTDNFEDIYTDITIEVVNSLSISYTPLYEDGATNANTYEFSKNVKADQQIGVITHMNGIDPITYKIVADASNSDDYENFKLDKTTTNGSETLKVVVDSSGPSFSTTVNSLHVKTYNFCIVGTDKNGSPVDNDGNYLAKVCTSLEVKKTKPPVSFSTPEITLKSISEAALGWQESATIAAPHSNEKVTYSVNGGVIGLLDIDPNTGDISIKDAKGFGKVIIQASADDKDTSYDNYLVATVTKEIYIYREIEGALVPDSASSNNLVPTFKISDSNIAQNGVIGTVTGSLGTPDKDESGKTTFVYSIKDSTNSSWFSVNTSTGIITTNTQKLGVGVYDITIIIKDNWSEVEIPVRILVDMAAAEVLKFYEPNTNKVITSGKAAVGDANVKVYAAGSNQDNTNPIVYSLKNGPSDVLSVQPNSGELILQKPGTVTIVASKSGLSGQSDARVEMPFTVEKGKQSNFMFVDEAGNQLSYNDNKYEAISLTYHPTNTTKIHAKSFVGAKITFALKTGSTSDVVTIDEHGVLNILNATLPTMKDKLVIVATSSDPDHIYEDATIEIAVNVNKAEQVISFVDSPIYVVQGTGTVTPVMQEQDISSNVGGIVLNNPQYILSVDGSVDTAIAWTDGSASIAYEYNNVDGIDIPIEVQKQGNRNYNGTSSTGILRIMGQDESTLVISSPGKITYGDEFTIQALQDDSSSVNVVYTFELQNETYVTKGNLDGNSCIFYAKKASENNIISLTVSRTATGELPLSRKLNIKVLPKNVNITIDNQEVYTGEAFPKFTYENFANQLVTWENVQDVILDRDIKLTTAANVASTVGTYPIQGDAASLQTIYSNYSFTITNGTLNLKQEAGQNLWFHLEDLENNIVSKEEWHNEDIKVVLDSAMGNAGNYNQISEDKLTWNSFYKIDTEGDNIYDVFFRIDPTSEASHKGAYTSAATTTIKIDKTKPTIKKVTGDKVNDNGIAKFANAITLGTFFKPGVKVTIESEDVNADKTIQTSGIASIHYELFSKSDSTFKKVDEGDAVLSASVGIVVVEESGIYRICSVATDKAGNVSDEYCSELTIKMIDVDVDNDGELDFNDPDNDGCPDINIVLEADSSSNSNENKWVKLNVDRNGDLIPDLNIDSTGDGLADINIDTDNDGKPDVNITNLKEWTPTLCVKGQNDSEGNPIEYCTMPSIKALINVDTNNDLVPDINIDTTGDLKANINTVQDGLTTILNYVNIKNWVPDNDLNVEGFLYDSMQMRPTLNIDTDGDGRPDIQLDLDGDYIADLNIDVNGDGIPDLNIDCDADGKPDINIDTDKDGTANENIYTLTEWKPEKDGKKDNYLFDTIHLIFNPSIEDKGIVVELPNGTFLPNYALRVTDITDTVDDNLNKSILENSDTQEIKKHFKIDFMKDNISIQPDGTIILKIPFDETIKNPRLLMKQIDGQYKEIESILENGYFIFEADFIGEVVIVGDLSQASEDKEEEEDDTTVNNPTIDTNKPTVKGDYISGIGGAITGDETTVVRWILALSISYAGVILMICKQLREET